MTSSTGSDHLVPRMRDLPISNARYFQRAVITEVVPPSARHTPEWRLSFSRDTPDEAEWTAVALDPTGQAVACGAVTGTIQVRALATADVLWSRRLEPGHQVSSLAFSPNGTTLAACDVEGSLWLMDAATGEDLPSPISTSIFPGFGVAWTAGGEVVVAVRTSNALELRSHDGDWSTAMTRLPPQGFNAVRARLSGDDPLVGTLDAEGTTSFWGDGQGGRMFSGGDPGQVMAVAARSGTIVTGALNRVQLWDTIRGVPIDGSWHGDRVIDLALDDDGRRLATLTDDGVVGVLSLEDMDRTEFSASPGGATSAVALSADGMALAAVSSDGSVHVWLDQGALVGGPLALPPPGSSDDSARPAIGVLLTHEQSWTMQGIALGELLHTVSLAPGEVTQVAMSSHIHNVVQGSRDVATQRESLDQSGTSASSLAEHERSSASEVSAGTSTAMSASASMEAGAGGLLGFLGASGGMSTHTATGLQASFSSGSRNVADESSQDLHQQSTEQARLDRQRHTASVREVSEGDALELRTRVVANYNHMHALTMQYYEAMEIQQLRTRVVDAHRLLFVPMTIVDFESPSRGTDDQQPGTDDLTKLLATQRRPLVTAARALGLFHAVAAIDLLALGDGNADRQLDRITATWQREIDADTALKTASADLETAQRQADADRHTLLVARDAMREATNPGLATRDDLQAAIRAAVAALSTTAAEVVSLREAVDDIRRARDAARQDRRDLEGMLRMVGAIADRDDDTTGDDDSDAPPSLRPPTIDVDTLAAVEDQVRAELARHRLPLSQALWMRIDPGTWAALLGGRTFRGSTLGQHLDPTPVAVAGNRVGFRWHHADPEESAAFRRTHVDDVEPLLASVAMPTGGVFGEAVLGDANAAEKIDITRFWKWTDSLPPLLPTQIEPLAQPTPDEEDTAMPTRADVPASHTQLGPITFPQVASTIPTSTAALSDPDLFSDLSGTAASAALARSAMEHTAAGASEAADLASDNFARHLAFQQTLSKVAMDHIRTAAQQGAGPTIDPTMAGAAANARAAELGTGTTGVTESHEPGRPPDGAAGGGTPAAGGMDIGGLPSSSSDPADAVLDRLPSAEFVVKDPPTDASSAATPAPTPTQEP